MLLNGVSLVLMGLGVIFAVTPVSGVNIASTVYTWFLYSLGHHMLSFVQVFSFNPTKKITSSGSETRKIGDQEKGNTSSDIALEKM